MHKSYIDCNLKCWAQLVIFILRKRKWGSECEVDLPEWTIFWHPTHVHKWPLKYASINFSVTDRFQPVGKFIGMKSMNDEDWLYKVNRNSKCKRADDVSSSSLPSEPPLLPAPCSPVLRELLSSISYWSFQLLLLLLSHFSRVRLSATP